MTFEELLISCGSGRMPTVKSTKPIKGATSNIGTVIAIKFDKHYKGCAVQFPGKHYDDFFHAVKYTDGKRKYLSDLVLHESTKENGVLIVDYHGYTLEEDNNDYWVSRSGDLIKNLPKEEFNLHDVLEFFVDVIINGTI